MSRIQAFVSIAVIMAAVPFNVAAQDIFPSGGLTASEMREVRSTYIVELDPSVAFRDVDREARAIAAQFNGQITHVYGRAYRGFAMRMSDAALTRLLRDDSLGAITVTRDDVVTISAPPPGKGPNSDAPLPDAGGDATCTQELGWNVARVTGMTDDGSCGTGLAKADYGADTTHIRRDGTKADPEALLVCVIDTGIDLDHPDLAYGRRMKHFNLTREKSADDLNGHGTHVAGIIGAVANQIGVVGVAPGTKVTAIKVLNRFGAGRWSTVIAGIDTAAVIGCNVANLSLGGARYTPIDEAVQCAAGIGNGCEVNSVMFTIAAGNSAVDTEGYSPAAASQSDDDGIYTIASFAEGDLWSSFSNFDANGTAPIVEFALPGSAVRSTVPGGGTAVYSGTSMAAPHMAGLLVRYLSDRGAVGVIPNSSFDVRGSVQRDAAESYPVPADGGAPGA